MKQEADRKPVISPKPLVAALALASVTGIPQVIAQESGPTLALEEVVVTARRRDESLQDVPVAVTAFTADALDSVGVADITELANTVPSLMLEASRATNTTLTAFIRGIGQQDPLAGFEQGVAIYLDDVYLNRPQGALLDVYDVERIEVLRGPQGTLYGRNSVGGAIKYVTRRLSEEPEFSIRGSLGSYNQRDIIGTAAVPISDSFRVGATVASFNRDGFGDNLFTGGEQYDKDIFGYRISAEFIPNDDWLIRFSYDNTQDDSAPRAGHRPFPGVFTGLPVLGDVFDTRAGAADDPSTAGINGNNEVEAEGWMLSIDWQLNDEMRLRSITAYREDYTESVIDFDALPADDFDAPVIYDNEQTSQEFQLHYQTDRLYAVVGAYYLDASAANDFDVVLGTIDLAIPTFAPGITAYTGGVVDTEAWSLFADVTYDLTERWSISVGGRYTDDERSADILRASYLGIGSPAFGNDAAFFLSATTDYEATKSFTDFSPRINLQYRMNDDVTFYGGYSQGWKAGTFDPRGSNFVFSQVLDGVEPETLDSVEFGMKATWFDGRATTNIAVFFSEYEDVQVPGSAGLDTDGDGINDSFVGTLFNAGAAEIDGIEFEGNFLLHQNLSATLSFSFLDAEYTEYVTDVEDVSDQVNIQNTPEEMISAGLNYTVDIAGGSLNLNATWSYKGDISQFEFPNETLDQESYDIWNASVVWRSGDEHWMVGLHGKNLGDELIKTSGYCFGASAGCSTVIGFEDNTTVFYAPPRTITGTVEYRF